MCYMAPDLPPSLPPSVCTCTHCTHCTAGSVSGPSGSFGQSQTAQGGAPAQVSFTSGDGTSGAARRPYHPTCIYIFRCLCTCTHTMHPVQPDCRPGQSTLQPWTPGRMEYAGSLRVTVCAPPAAAAAAAAGGITASSSDPGVLLGLGIPAVSRTHGSHDTTRMHLNTHAMPVGVWHHPSDQIRWVDDQPASQHAASSRNSQHACPCRVLPSLVQRPHAAPRTHLGLACCPASMQARARMHACCDSRYPACTWPAAPAKPHPHMLAAASHALLPAPCPPRAAPALALALADGRERAGGGLLSLIHI